MTLRWGILGAARITRRGLVPGIRESRTGTLVALASRDLATARAWCGEFGIPKAYGSYQELLADPEIDAVYIPLPNELHRSWTQAAADAGKHVLCDKPLALTDDEAAGMVSHCRSRGVLLMEGFMWRHQPRALALRQMVCDGRIGDLRLIRCSFSFPIDPSDWRLDPARGGGPLWDVGCYGVNTARYYAGAEPLSIAGAAARFASTGVEMNLAAVLRFPGDVLASIDCSFEQPFRCVYELVGTRGVIDVPDAFLPPTGTSPLARLRTTGTASSVDAGDDPDEVLEFDRTNQYAAMVDAFAASVAAGQLVDPAEDGLSQMNVLQQIRDIALGRNA